MSKNIANNNDCNPVIINNAHRITQLRETPPIIVITMIQIPSTTPIGNNIKPR